MWWTEEGNFIWKHIAAVTCSLLCEHMQVLDMWVSNDINLCRSNHSQQSCSDIFLDTQTPACLDHKSHESYQASLNKRLITESFVLITSLISSFFQRLEDCSKCHVWLFCKQYSLSNCVLQQITINRKRSTVISNHHCTMISNEYKWLNRSKFIPFASSQQCVNYLLHLILLMFYDNQTSSIFIEFSTSSKEFHNWPSIRRSVFDTLCTSGWRSANS